MTRVFVLVLLFYTVGHSPASDRDKNPEETAWKETQTSRKEGTKRKQSGSGRGYGMSQNRHGKRESKQKQTKKIAQEGGFFFF